MKKISFFKHAGAALLAAFAFTGVTQPALAHSDDAQMKEVAPLLLNPGALKMGKDHSRSRRPLTGICNPAQ